MGKSKLQRPMNRGPLTLLARTSKAVAASARQGAMTALTFTSPANHSLAGRNIAAVINRGQDARLGMRPAIRSGQIRRREWWADSGTPAGAPPKHRRKKPLPRWLSPALPTASKK